MPYLVWLGIYLSIQAKLSQIHLCFSHFICQCEDRLGAHRQLWKSWLIWARSSSPFLCMHREQPSKACYETSWRQETTATRKVHCWTIWGALGGCENAHPWRTNDTDPKAEQEMPEISACQKWEGHSTKASWQSERGQTTACQTSLLKPNPGHPYRQKPQNSLEDLTTFSRSWEFWWWLKTKGEAWTRVHSSPRLGSWSSI